MEEPKGKVTVSDPTQMKIDVQTEPFEPSVDVHAPRTSGGATDVLMRGSLGLRRTALFLSLVSFMLVVFLVSKNGDWIDFSMRQEYRYLLAVAILSVLYNGVQAFRQSHEPCNGKNMLQPRTAGLIDFVGDQVVAYLLLSSTSSAIPITHITREIVGKNIFTDTLAAAIAMSFLAFCCLALSAVISGYKLFTRTYI
ncbi:hypothetical protein VNO80_01168 [Phaseolus coccineus]|uniref:CASP-like protein n=1 Tax=Phaseolus coccineus TaxID=3886 RepID=A0AAN9P0V1_PHACN